MSTFLILSHQSFATEPDISASTTTVSCNDSAINTNNAPANLEINWEPNTINLHWYADENATTEMTVPTASQSCVYDGTLTPPSTIPTRTGYTFRGWKVRGLPDEYTRLQYIESNGSQVINTGISVGTSYGLKTAVKLQLTTTDTSERAIWGPRDYCGGYEVYFSNGKYVGFYRKSGQAVYVPVNYTTGVPYTITTEMTSNSMTINVNGVQRQYSGTVSAADSNNITLFGMCGKYRISARVYYANMWNNNVLVRRFIPAKRNSDNVVGMWDMVTKTFFTNAGTGSFTAGPVAQ